MPFTPEEIEAQEDAREARKAAMMGDADAEFTPSSFGGGWIVPRMTGAAAFLFHFFGEEPGPLMPLGGEVGYIVEPFQLADLAEALSDGGFYVEGLA